MVRWLVALFMLIPSLAWAAVTARLDRTQAREGETVQLILEATGGSAPQADTKPLKQDFTILGTSSSSRYTITNGRAQATSQWIITLQPRHQGQITIPALTTDGGATQPLTLTVTAAGAADSPQKNLFLTASVEPGNPYVQSQAILTVRLYRAVEVMDGEFQDPVPDNAMVERLGQDHESTTTLQGQTYKVVERRYALFPQKSGAMTVPGVVFEGKVLDKKVDRNNPLGQMFDNQLLPDPFRHLPGGDPFANLLGTTRPVRLVSGAIQLAVRPQPPLFQGAWWLPAKDLVLDEAWKPDTGPIRVGEPMTRTLYISALGITGAQLPEITRPVVAGIKVYPDQPVIGSKSFGNWIQGSREEKLAYVAAAPGSYTLPAVRIPWWDIKNERMQVAQLPSHTITVLPALATAPAPGRAPAAAPPPPVSAPVPSLPEVLPLAEESVAVGAGVWPWLTLLCLLGWVGTGAAWWLHTRQGPLALPGISGLMRTSAVRRACLENDPHKAREALLAWGRGAWPGEPLVSLADLATRLHSAQAGALFDALEAALYAPGGGAWQGGEFWRLLSPLLEAPTVREKAASGLSPLHPA